ncbi:hypothetical protein AZE42_10342, partial [Rhizopogon vesiculosus]
MERNVYWDPSCAGTLSREGEDEGVIPGAMITPQLPPLKSIPTPVQPIPAPVQSIPVPIPAPEPEPPRCIRKPSQCILDIINANGTIPHGIRVPPIIEVDEPADIKEEDTVERLLSIIEDPDDKLCSIDLSMAIGEATAESEALEPRTLAEAR